MQTETKTRPVEVIICYADNRWDTKTVEMPQDIVRDYVADKPGAMEAVYKKAAERFYNNPDTRDMVAYVGIYHVPPPEGG